MTGFNTKGVKKYLTRFMSLGLLVAAASCDTEVINPGPTDSRLINDASSTEALVNGAGRALADALNWIAYTSAAISREVHPSGSTGSFGITPEQQRGELLWDQVGGQWGRAHRARFLADEAISLPAARACIVRRTRRDASVWAPRSTRVLGCALEIVSRRDRPLSDVRPRGFVSPPPTAKKSGRRLARGAASAHRPRARPRASG